MSVIATVDVDADAFTLGAALASNPGLRVDVERVVPLGGTFIPYFWVADGTVDDIEASLRAEGDIESFKVVDEVDGEALVRVEWKEGIDGLLDAIVESDGILLEAHGEADSWRLQLRFPDHADLTDFYQRCAERDIRLELDSVHNPGPPTPVGLDLTDVQRETLVAALEAGYFEVPRRTNLVELASSLGISDTAASQRLRRGIRAVLGESLPEDREDGEGESPQ